jgi:aryl-alcohol dehydrogenase-like predicted oxidoreductase
MLKNRLGSSDLEISPLGIGTWAMGGDWAFGWGPQNDKDSIQAIRKAVELGANWIDTAPVYGLGHSERIVGMAIAELGEKRPLVFTKCGMVWDENGKVSKCLSALSVRKECDASLQRLGVEAIDLLQIHWPTGNFDELQEAWEEMGKLQQEGKVRYLGGCNLKAEDLAKLQQIHQVTSLQCAYSMVDSNVSGEDLDFTKSHGIGFLAYSPLGSGLLTSKHSKGNLPSPKFHEDLTKLADTDWRRKNTKFNGAELEKKLAIAGRASIIGRSPKRNATLIETALGYVLSDHRVIGAIVGIRNEQQAIENFGNFPAIERMARVFSAENYMEADRLEEFIFQMR